MLQTTLNENNERYFGSHNDWERYERALNAYVKDLKARPIAESTEKANDQHYEVPAKLYQVMLGPNLKYSSCLWEDEETNRVAATLAESEEMMLQKMCDRAELNKTDKFDVLDLGCGWGSAGLFIAKNYPNVTVSMVSNSNSQREFILNKAKELGLTNVKEVYTMDANTMDFAPESFDRIVSNEMFEHLKNYEMMFGKVAKWLKSGGKFFIHIFTHKLYAYHYVEGWMAETFFTGGQMPSKDLFLHFQKDLYLDQSWVVNGNNYSKTLEAWLVRLDNHKADLLPLLDEVYGKGEGAAWHFNWRLFNLACSELFKYNDGNEWFVTHYRFVKR